MTDENGRNSRSIYIIMSPYYKPRPYVHMYSIHLTTLLCVWSHSHTIDGRGYVHTYIHIYILYMRIIEINCAHSIRNRASGSRTYIVR